jgi:uncharacterized protein
MARALDKYGRFTDTLLSMKLNREITTGMLLIDAYDASSITIRGQQHTGSQIVRPAGLQAWPVEGVAALRAEDFLPICALKPALVLIGTGVRQHFPPPALLRPLIEARIGFEIMDTGSACRTYNLLAAEGREVLAALLLDSAP